MNEELFAEATTLVEVEQDTMAAIEMVLTAVFEQLQHPSAAAHHNTATPNSSSAAHMASSAAILFDTLIKRAAPPTLQQQGASLSDVLALAHDELYLLSASASHVSSSSSSSSPLHAVDARELLTGIFSVVGAKMRNDPSAEDAGDHEDEDATAASTLHDLRSILLVAPHILRIAQSALPLLFLQSLRRVARSSATATAASLKINAVWSVVAWVPQLLRHVRELCALASQQDGNVHFVEASTDDDVGGDVASGANPSSSSSRTTTTSTTPHMIETAVLEAGGVVDAAVALVKDCCALMQQIVAASDEDKTGGHLDQCCVLPPTRRDLYFTVSHELFMTMCTLRIAPITSVVFRESREGGGAKVDDAAAIMELTGLALLDGKRSNDVSISSTLPRPYSSLNATVRTLETDAETKHRQFKANQLKQRQLQEQAQQQHQTEVATTTPASCNHSHHQHHHHDHHHAESQPTETLLPTAPLPSPLIVQRFSDLRHLCCEVVSICATPVIQEEASSTTVAAAPPGGKETPLCFFNVATQTLSSKFHPNEHLHGNVQCNPKCAKDEQKMLLDLVQQWSGAVQQELLEKAGESSVGQNKDIPIGSKARKHCPRAIAARLRDRAYYSQERQQHGTTAETTSEEDERRMLTKRMEVCTQLESDIEPLLLIVSSDDEDDDDNEHRFDDDGSQTTADRKCLPVAAGACALSLPGALLVLLDHLSDNQKEGPCAEWLMNGSVSLSHVTELAGLAPIRLMLRSTSLSAVSCGLRLWAALLSLLPKYSLDIPGEVRLTILNTASHGHGQEEEGASNHLRGHVVTVECEDILLNNSESLLDVSAPLSEAPPAPSSSSQQEALAALQQNDGSHQQKATKHGNSFRTNRFAKHYYLFQDLLSVVVTSPSSPHRIAGRSIALRKHLPWYVASLRSKLLCQIIFTAPYGSVATALLQKLKEEIVESYTSVVKAEAERRMPSANDAINAAHDDSSLFTPPDLLSGSGRWFLNLSVLQYLLGALRQWTSRCCRKIARTPAASNAESGSVVRIASPPQAATSQAGDSSFVEAVATALNIVYTMLQWEQRIAVSRMKSLSSSLPSTTTIVSALFQLSAVSSSSASSTTTLVWKALASKPSATSSKRNRLVASCDFMFVLREAVCRPWAAACDAALNNNDTSPMMMSPLDAFSIEEMIQRIASLMVDQ